MTRPFTLRLLFYFCLDSSKCVDTSKVFFFLDISIMRIRQTGDERTKERDRKRIKGRKKKHREEERRLERQGTYRKDEKKDKAKEKIK